MNGRDALVYFSLKYHGQWSEVVKAIRTREVFDTPEAEKAVRDIACPYVTIVDKAYPESFRHCYKPPLVLFYYGNLGFLSDEKKCISYIGSRDASEYGLQMAESLAGSLAKEGFVIVSGLARGIDAAATKAALENHGRAVGIMGNGIDRCYPPSSEDLYQELKSYGLVLSEYPGKTPPDKENFPFRNRLVAAVSKGLIVGEASTRSGTLITVGFALDMSKEVGCVPFQAGLDSACNVLIKEGAWMLEDVDDVHQMMDFAPEKKEGEK